MNQLTVTKNCAYILIHESRTYRTSSLRVLQVPRDVLPVDDVPNRVYVVGPHVLVLQVIRVLPDVDAEKRREASGAARVLVRGRGDGELASGFLQPEPAPPNN